MELLEEKREVASSIVNSGRFGLCLNFNRNQIWTDNIRILKIKTEPALISKQNQSKPNHIN